MSSTNSICLVYQKGAEEAAKFYTSIFKNSKILMTNYCGENEPSGPPGSVRTVLFELNDQLYFAVNGGPHPGFTFTDGVSLVVCCDTQEEIDYYWEKLSSEGGKEVVCGWVVDKFGLRWQIHPKILFEMMCDPDQRKTQNLQQAVLKMKKIDIKKLQEAFSR